MAQLIHESTPIWKTILISSAVLGGLLLVGGIWLAYVGGSAETTFTLFGNQFSSTSVGVTMAFIGVVLIALNVRRVLESLDKILGGRWSDKKKAV